MSTVTATFRHKPSTLAYMGRALLPSRGLGPDARFPALTLCWRALRLDPDHHHRFQELTGLTARNPAWVLYPHVFGFSLVMALLTHRAFPLPIWNALQTRNHLVLHRPLRFDTRYDLETRVGERRVLEKGLELDLLTHLTADGESHWESRTTFFYRGRFGAAGRPSPLAQSTRVNAPVVAEWQMPEGGGWAFGGLTGDYNGIHCWKGYAQRFGFPAAFLHPQRATGLCLARLPDLPDSPQRLDLWLKGPVFYGSPVQLRAPAERGAELPFALRLRGDDRDALVGRWSALAG